MGLFRQKNLLKLYRREKRLATAVTEKRIVSMISILNCDKLVHSQTNVTDGATCYQTGD